MTGSQEPTHAGGVVYRIVDGAPEILLVTARRKPFDWVYPKGHIEPGETPEEAAAREVEEEAGVTATVVELLEDVRINVAGRDQIIRFFLMRAGQDGPPGEGRRSVWLSPPEALEHLVFPEARASLNKALQVITAEGLR